MDESKLKYLLKLIDDPSNEVYEAIEPQIVDQGFDALAILEKTWESSLNEMVQERTKKIISIIQFNSLKMNLSDWVKSGATDILLGTYLIAKYQYPDLEFKEISDKVGKISHDIWLEINPNLTALEKVKVINHIFFDIHKFSGNTLNYYAPKNSFINEVLDAKKGSPISLAIIYSAVSQQLNIPIYGINLPKNFILAYIDELSTLSLAEGDHNEKVLFYLNPFNRGLVFNKTEIDVFLKQQKLKPQASYYLPCSNVNIVVRLINNLIASYKQLVQAEKIEDLNELLRIIEEA
ncbi:MAG: hypothetical protein HN704_04130 [Bacteroidetes bacterium]|jgi:regulator of sirC expression with transglutaminase-like and TPR domain|nr:hypothetical protein [Bacteroidota bacterium]MBT6687216.1 hypothetical protein [Bacteroidota bacterium]MBT7144581.1 hypothetical protein [Bacteroidota bacterium]MBT7490781.1 hypothetical protein [Bacteroidota bacterium]